MQYVRNQYSDGSSELAAVLTPLYDVYFFWQDIDHKIGHIDSEGNLNLKGKLFENCDPKQLLVAHNKIPGQPHLCWPTPDLMQYNGVPVTGILHQDVNSTMGLAWPVCFWDADGNFYVWGTAKLLTEGSPEHNLKFEPTKLDDGNTYFTMVLRGKVNENQQLDKDSPVESAKEE